jgi:hypothetical protein
MKNRILNQIGVFFVTCLIVLLFSQMAMAATYYIDYVGGSDSNNGTTTSTPWKRCPGMPGFAGSYTHDDTNGDTFIFKGGVTWPYVSGGAILTIQNNGVSAGKEDVYKGGQSLETPWGNDYPVFDGGNNTAAIGGITTYSGTTPHSHIIIEYLKLINIGTSVDGEGTAIASNYGGSNINIRYNYLSPNCIDAFNYGPSIGTYQDLNIHHNIIRQTGRIAFDVGGTLTGFNFYNNTWEGGWDFSPSGTYHTDGIMFNGNGVTDYSIKNINIYNNHFWGDWILGGTAMLYFSGATNGSQMVTQHTKIYNNVFSPSNSLGSGGSAANCILIKYGHDDVQIYNNTIDSRTVINLPSFGIIAYSSSGMTNTSNITIKNNIILGFFRAITFGNLGGTNVIDNNSFYDNSRIYLHDPTGTAYTTCAQAIAGGVMTVCTDTDPLFTTNITAAGHGDVGYGLSNGDLSLQSGSPARDIGADLSTFFTTDILGNPRTSFNRNDITKVNIYRAL